MAFNPKTWYLISKELADIWGELEEETLQLDTTKLVKDYHKGTEEWYRQQIKDTPAFAKKVEELARKHLKAIEEETKNALAKAVEIADKETLKSVEEVAKIKGDITGSKDEFLAASIERFSDFNKGKVSAFVNAAVNRNGVMINNIRTQAENIANTNVRVKSGMWNPTQGLYDLIKKQTEEGIKYGVPVVYSNGRQVSFKAHMEMSVRTKLQNETSERMENATRALGIVFFLASEHADSADDHAPYQGKIYIDENWETAIGTDEVLKEMIRKYIDKNNIKTLQWVKGKPVYFQTRPNCRHYLIPITVMQALGNIDMLKSKLKTKKGDYLERNYSDLKRQRYNERAIRYYKNRYENGVIMYKSTNDPVLKQHILQGLAKDKYLVKKWQHEQRQLILSNKELIRDYDRETVEKLAQDFGVKLQFKNVDKISDDDIMRVEPHSLNDDLPNSDEDNLNFADKIESITDLNELRETTFNQIKQKSIIKKIDYNVPKDKVDIRMAKKNFIQLENLTSEYHSDMIELRYGATTNNKTNGQVQRIGTDNHSIMYMRQLPRRADTIGTNYLGVVDEENRDVATLTHEFAHTFSSYRQTLLGAVRKVDMTYSVDHEAFWKEINSIKRRYGAELNNIQKASFEGKITSDEFRAKRADMYISEYANKSPDEFLAESFSTAKLSSKPSPYAVEVLEIVDKYFKKE